MTNRLDLSDLHIAQSGRGVTGMEYKIIGSTLQAVILELNAGETIYAEQGGMAWMSGNISMRTTLQVSNLKALVKTILASEALFRVEFTAQKQKGFVAFGSNSPGKILAVHVEQGREMICQKQAVLCSERTVEVDVYFQRRLRVGLFGGEGFILQRLSGIGVAFVSLDGEIVEYTLAPGEVLKLDPGCVGMYEPSIEFKVEMVKGLMNLLFGEGPFLAVLRGPGRVWLQTMPIEKSKKADS